MFELISLNKLSILIQLRDLVGLTAYRYIYCVFIYYLNVFFFVGPKNDIRFLEKLVIKILFKIKINFSLCSTEETKTLIIPIY